MLVSSSRYYIIAYHWREDLLGCMTASVLLDASSAISVDRRGARARHVYTGQGSRGEAPCKGEEVYMGVSCQYNARWPHAWWACTFRTPVLWRELRMAMSGTERSRVGEFEILYITTKVVDSSKRYGFDSSNIFKMYIPNDTIQYAQHSSTGRKSLQSMPQQYHYTAIPIFDKLESLPWLPL